MLEDDSTHRPDTPVSAVPWPRGHHVAPPSPQENGRDKYSFVKLLGEGAFGQVWLVEDPDVGKQFAMKVVKVASQGEQGVSRFIKEASKLYDIRSEHVVRLFTHGYLPDRDSTPYYVMEYIQGRTLKAEIVKHTHGLEWRIACDIFVQMCKGLAAIHELALVHRDLKPDNCMLQVKRRSASPEAVHVTLIDLGIIKDITPDATSLTATNALIGTLKYMSPEQLGGEEVTFSSDIYAMGLILHEMLTCEVPFSPPPGSNFYAWYNERCISTRSMPSVAQRRAPGTYPPDIDRVIHHCLQRDPKSRYQLVGDLIASVLEIDASFQTAPKSAPPRLHPQGQAQAKDNGDKRKSSVKLWTGFALCVAVALALALRWRPNAEALKDPSTPPSIAPPSPPMEPATATPTKVADTEIPPPPPHRSEIPKAIASAKTALARLDADDMDREKATLRALIETPAPHDQKEDLHAAQDVLAEIIMTQALECEISSALSPETGLECETINREVGELTAVSGGAEAPVRLSNLSDLLNRKDFATNDKVDPIILAWAKAAPLWRTKRSSLPPRKIALALAETQDDSAMTRILLALARFKGGDSADARSLATDGKVGRSPLASVVLALSKKPRIEPPKLLEAPPRWADVQYDVAKALKEVSEAAQMCFAKDAWSGIEVKFDLHIDASGRATATAKSRSDEKDVACVIRLLSEKKFPVSDTGGSLGQRKVIKR